MLIQIGDNEIFDTSTGIFYERRLNGHVKILNPKAEVVYVDPKYSRGVWLFLLRKCEVIYDTPKS